MKVKILSCNFDETTGKTDIVIATKYGVFSASSKPCAEDKPYTSKLFGGEVAEKKAVIKALKSHRRDLEQKFAGVHHIYNIYMDSRGKVPKCIESYIEGLSEDIYYIGEQIAAIESAIERCAADHVKNTKRLRAKAKK